MINKVKVFQEYCTGCGLCQSVKNVKFNIDENGFNIPELSDEMKDFCQKVCPAGGASSDLMDQDNIWGKYVSTYIGWSQDSNIRKSASSGGIITALCCWLLENKYVDGIIQTKEDSTTTVYSTKTVVSRNKQEVCECVGSRYSISSPLTNLKELIRKGERYAFVGKPCDISALRLYMKNDLDMANAIIYTFSFFCAGVPSVKAQKELLKKLGCKDEKDCLKLSYRGNGWPGATSLHYKDGKVSEMSYIEAWGGILGRNVRKSCRFCFDGVGDFADVSCGDAWHLNSDNTPDFNEHDGQNIIFARTAKGNMLLQEAIKDGVIVAHSNEHEIEQLKNVQYYQYERRATMKVMLDALRFFNRPTPKYNKRILKKYEKEISFRKRIHRFLGTIKRILAGKV